MMKNKLILLLGILISTACVIVFIGNYVRQSADTVRPAIEVIYRVRGGLVPVDNVLTITNNGYLIYVEKEYPMEESVTTKLKLSPEELKEFRKLILEADVFSFEDKYREPPFFHDRPAQIIVFNVNGKTKKISLRASEGPTKKPDSLTEILNKIYEFRKKFE